MNNNFRNLKNNMLLSLELAVGFAAAIALLPPAF